MEKHTSPRTCRLPVTLDISPLSLAHVAFGSPFFSRSLWLSLVGSGSLSLAHETKECCSRDGVLLCCYADPTDPR